MHSVKHYEMSNEEMNYARIAREAGWSNGPDAWSNLPNPENFWGKDGAVHDAGNVRAYESAEECCRAEGLLR